MNALLIAGADDWVYLAEVLRIIESVGGAPTESARQRTLDLLREVAEQRLIEIGDLRKDGFHKWQMPIGECLSRVEREWNALGRNPSLGEVCWLQITDRGRELGEQILKQREVSP
jgi:hypothetical protein